MLQLVFQRVTFGTQRTKGARFFCQNPLILRFFFGKIQKQIMNPMYPHSRKILRIKPKSAFSRLEFVVQAFSWERIRKKYIWQVVTL